MTKLESEGWKLATEGPVFAAGRARETGNWWVTMRRSVPVTAFEGEGSTLFRPKPKSDSVAPHRLAGSYSPIAGLL
jgi:hypothetical protein